MTPTWQFHGYYDADYWGYYFPPVCKIIWSTITWLVNWIGVLNMTKFRAALKSIFEPCSHFDWPPASVAYSLAELWSPMEPFQERCSLKGRVHPCTLLRLCSAVAFWLEITDIPPETSSITRCSAKINTCLTCPGGQTQNLMFGLILNVVNICQYVYIYIYICT